MTAGQLLEQTIMSTNMWKVVVRDNEIRSHIHLIYLCLAENPSLEKQDTFVEKLVTQVIKNLQVKISNIHVRYEDDVSIQAKVTLVIYVCTAYLKLPFK